MIDLLVDCISPIFKWMSTAEVHWLTTSYGIDIEIMNYLSPVHVFWSDQQASFFFYVRYSRLHLKVNLYYLCGFFICIYATIEYWKKFSWLLIWFAMGSFWSFVWSFDLVLLGTSACCSIFFCLLFWLNYLSEFWGHCVNQRLGFPIWLNSLLSRY